MRQPLVEGIAVRLPEEKAVVEGAFITTEHAGGVVPGEGVHEGAVLGPYEDRFDRSVRGPGVIQDDRGAPGGQRAILEPALDIRPKRGLTRWKRGLTP